MITGCAYHWGLSGRGLPGGYRQISIPVFKNLTQEVGGEVSFTNAIVREFSQSQLAEVVSSDVAPVRLDGEIKSLTYESRSAGQSKEILALPKDAVLTTNYRILIVTRLVLRRTSDQAILWQGDITNERVYPAPRIGSAVVNSANVLYNQSAREMNVVTLADEMMAEAHDRMTENF